MTDLFPVFDVPEVIAENESSAKQRSAIYFDFENGDFKLDNTGKIETASSYDSWVQWCLKTVFTQRFAYLAYSSQTGVELEEAFSQNDRASQESYIERTITEALLADPYSRTKRVYDFKFNWLTDGVRVEFIISGIWNDDYNMNVQIKRN